MINKTALLKEMVILADTLDDMGLTKEADDIDGMMEKVALWGLEDVRLQSPIALKNVWDGVSTGVKNFISKRNVGKRPGPNDDSDLSGNLGFQLPFYKMTPEEKKKLQDSGVLDKNQYYGSFYDEGRGEVKE